MTREEAIRRLEGGAPFSELYDEVWENALIMAIEALKAEPIKQGVWKVYDILDYAKRPTGRKIAQCSNCGKLTPEFRRLSEMPNWNFCPTCGYLMRKENEDISNSGVGQKGHWVFRAQGVSCSICGAKAPDVTGLPSECKVCGAKMY